MSWYPFYRGLADKNHRTKIYKRLAINSYLRLCVVVRDERGNLSQALVCKLITII